jgi:hypothetical protein
MMRKVILALAMIGFTLPALAQMADFATADANSDNMVSMEEASGAGLTWTDEEFKAADADGDGSLSEEEFAAASAQ